MNISYKITIAFSFMSFHSVLFTDGSFLFCSDKDGNWEWAKKPDGSYFWLEGGLHIVDTPDSPSISIHSSIKLSNEEVKRNKRSIPLDMENENNFLNHYSQKFLFLNADQFQNDWENFKLFFSLYSFENEDLDNWEEWKNWDKFSNEEILSRKKRTRAPTSADLNQKKPSKNGINACEKLQNYCLKISNNSLNYVGASGNALSATDWGYVVADNIICPNWHYPRGKIVGSGSSLDVFIGGIVIDLATSGPMKGNYPTMISGSGFSTPKSGISSAAGKAAPVVVNRETPTHVIPQANAKVSSVEKPFSYADQVRGILDKGLPNEKPIVNIEGATGERKISLKTS